MSVSGVRYTTYVGQMPPDASRIQQFIAALIRRERGLLLLRILLQGALVLLGLWAWAALAPALGLERPVAAALLVLLGGIGGWFAVARPLLVRWTRAADPLRQARRVEQMAPDLRGRLLAMVGPRAGALESPELLELVARRAADRVRRVDVAAVHPAGWLGVLGGLATLGMVIAMVLPMLAPGGIYGLMSWWGGQALDELAQERGAPEEDEELARVGDLVLRYRYPGYTGLEPREVPNSTGDASGPPGTVVEVEARSAEPVDAAALVAYDDPPLEVRVQDGRVLTGRFTIGKEEGTWRLITHHEGETTRSRPFAIDPEPDLPPEVTLETASDVLEVALNEPMELEWRARDDFGIRRVVIEVDGQQVGSPLAEPRERRAELFGIDHPRPRDLGLQEGDEVGLAIAAWDNDTVSGSKVGRSRTVEVKVLGPRGREPLDDARQRELRDRLLDLLADHLEEPWPPGRTSGQMASWGRAWGERYAELDEYVASLWPHGPPEGVQGHLLQRIDRTGRELIRYTQVSFTPGSRERPPGEPMGVTADMRDRAIVALENGILALDRMIRNRALRQVSEGADILSEMAASMRDMLEGEPDAQDVLVRLDQLEQRLQNLMEQAATMEEGGLREFVNQRGEQLESLIDEVRQALAEGDMDDARELMDRLARELEEMSDVIRDSLDQRQQGDQDGADAAQALQDELQALEQAQRDLQEQARELAEQDGSEQQVADLWERIDALAEQHAGDAAAFYEQFQAADGRFSVEQRAQSGAVRSRRVYESVSARDLRGAQDGVDRARGAWQSVQMLQQLQGGVPGAGPAELRALQGQLRELAELLSQLDQQARQGDPETQAAAQDLAQEQQQLEERLEQARQEAQEVARQFPMRPEGLDESLQGAGESMEQATDELGQGMPRPAEGAQETAAQHLQEAQRSLQEAMEHAQEMSQPLQGPPQDGQAEGMGGEDGEDGRPEGPTQRRVEIPAPEEFRTPEQYRQALLEGMEGEVPEQYRSIKRRYFEELVQQ